MKNNVIQRETEIIDNLIGKLENRISDSQAIIAMWADRVKENPSYHLSWARNAFAQAGALKWDIIILENLRDGQSPLTVMNRLRKELFRVATTFHQSTSPTSNLMDEFERCALGEICRSDWARHPLPRALEELHEISP